jgi:hypothetical protein
MKKKRNKVQVLKRTVGISTFLRGTHPMVYVGLNLRFHDLHMIK